MIAVFDAKRVSLLTVFTEKWRNENQMQHRQGILPEKTVRKSNEKSERDIGIMHARIEFVLYICLYKRRIEI